MELVQDLFLTASFALILSLLVAKLVAMAVASRESEPEFGECENAGEGVVLEEVSFEESRLKVEEVFHGQRRVEFVGEVKEVDQFQFEDKPVDRVEEIEEALRHHQERELTEKVLEEEESVPIVLPENLSDGEEKVSVEKARDFDHQNSENKGVEEIGVESTTNDVVTAQFEELRAVAFDEAKGKSEANEVEIKATDSDHQRGHDAQQSSENRGAESATNEVVTAQSEELSAVAFDEAKGKSEANEVEIKAADSDHERGHDAQQSSENRGAEEIGAESATNEVVTAQSEELSAVAFDETKGKREANEVEIKATDFDHQRRHDAQQSSENGGAEEIGVESATNDVVTAQYEELSVVASDEGKGKSEANKVEIKATDFDHQCGHDAQQSSENRGAEEIGSESATKDVVSAAQPEEVRAEAHVASEVKFDSYSDEDDWEGIEKSEFDDYFTAAAKFEGR